MFDLISDTAHGRPRRGQQLPPSELETNVSLPSPSAEGILDIQRWARQAQVHSHRWTAAVRHSHRGQWYFLSPNRTFTHNFEDGIEGSNMVSNPETDLQINFFWFLFSKKKKMQSMRTHAAWFFIQEDGANRGMKMSQRTEAPAFFYHSFACSMCLIHVFFSSTLVSQHMHTKHCIACTGSKQLYLWPRSFLFCSLRSFLRSYTMDDRDHKLPLGTHMSCPMQDAGVWDGCSTVVIALPHVAEVGGNSQKKKGKKTNDMSMLAIYLSLSKIKKIKNKKIKTMALFLERWTKFFNWSNSVCCVI